MIFMDWFQQEFKDKSSVAEWPSSNKLALLEFMLKNYLTLVIFSFCDCYIPAAQSCSSSSVSYYSLLKQTPIDLFEYFAKLRVSVYAGGV